MQVPPAYTSCQTELKPTPEILKGGLHEKSGCGITGYEAGHKNELTWKSTRFCVKVLYENIP